jgi:lipopolysaccharide/colanic/teichoic acid biosynthesis glycosyltransferase
MVYSKVKRSLDLVLAIPVFVLTLPLQAAIALAVALTLGRPVLFRQIRPGLNGKPFELVKFRTMRPLDHDRGWTDDNARLIRFGAWLRASSLDEVPSLWNVIRGDMSLVGPRPLLMEYLSLYSPDQARRHTVRPGITGLAQISGRNSLPWEERFRLDLKYVEHQTVWRDLRIMMLTPVAVARRRGISSKDHVTGALFTGNRPDADGS